MARPTEVHINKVFASALVFFLTNVQHEEIEATIATAMPRMRRTSKAIRRSLALIKICRIYQLYSEVKLPHNKKPSLPKIKTQPVSNPVT